MHGLVCIHCGPVVDFFITKQTSLHPFDFIRNLFHLLFKLYILQVSVLQFTMYNALTNICSWCNAWNSISWSYDSVCSDTVFNSSVGREVPQCELSGWCVGVVQYSSAVVGYLIHCDDTIRFWGSSPWDCELDHSWSGWQTRHWTRNCTGTHTNNATIMICSLLTILQCLHSESCTVWSSPSSIDCCHLHRVAGEWSQSSQHMLSAPSPVVFTMEVPLL